MSEAKDDEVEIKFRLADGSDIGPKCFPAATSVAVLKESILAQWPEEKENGPRTVKDVILISAGRILENNRTLGECRSPLCDVPGGVTTMHVVIHFPLQEKGQHKHISLPTYFEMGVVQALGRPTKLVGQLACDHKVSWELPIGLLDLSQSTIRT